MANHRSPERCLKGETSDVIAVFSSTRLPGFSGRNLLTTTGSSATSHHVNHFLSCLLKRAYRSHRPLRGDCRMMPGFPSYCTGSLLMITSSSTCCRCSRIGHCVFLHTHPDNRPNQVCLRYVPSTSYRFLQTPPLASDALANRILFPMNGARSLTSSDWVCQLRWANKKSPAQRQAERTFINEQHGV